MRRFSPPLADRVAARWEDGIASVALKLMEVVKPYLFNSLKQKPIVPLPQLDSGKDVVDIFEDCHFSYSHNDEPINEEEIDLVGGFIQDIRDWGDIWNDIDFWWM